MHIYFDSVQEGTWFQGLHPALRTAELSPFPSPARQSEGLRAVLEYDRPDIVLMDQGKAILVVERTIEVPSGHNVGQRFARLVAAARRRVPVVYFGPYAAYKHGGATQGPRYMNLRLFYSLAEVARIEQTAVTPINWPVDRDYEIIQTPDKDDRMREYLELFFTAYSNGNVQEVSAMIRQSDFERRQEAERDEFIRTKVRDAAQYRSPPDSVTIAKVARIVQLAGANANISPNDEVVFYNVGMRYIRSDPYTGMAMLYAYLYCGGMANRTRPLILYFPYITWDLWTAAGRARKDVRLFRLTADGIRFTDRYTPRAGL